MKIDFTLGQKMLLNLIHGIILKFIPKWSNICKWLKNCFLLMPMGLKDFVFLKFFFEFPVKRWSLEDQISRAYFYMKNIHIIYIRLILIIETQKE